MFCFSVVGGLHLGPSALARSKHFDFIMGKESNNSEQIDYKRENALQNKERFRVPEYVSGSYYDSPEGEDLHLKLLYTMKIAAPIGLLLGTMNAYAMHPLAIGHKQKLFRIAKAFIPTVGMAAAFTITTYFSTNLRKKDDTLNYFLGGCAAGMIYGGAVGSFSKGSMATLSLGMLAVAQKVAKENNVSLISGSLVKGGFSSYYMRNWDFSLLKDDIQGNWTRDPK